MYRTHRPRTHSGAAIDKHTIGKHEGAQQQLPVRLILQHATNAVTWPCAPCHAFLASLAMIPAVPSALEALE